MAGAMENTPLRNGNEEIEKEEKKRNLYNKIISAVSRKELWIAVLIGQSLSLCNGSSGIFSGLLQQQNVNIPTAQTFAVYVALALIYTTYLSFTSETSVFTILKDRGWKYFIIALLDVEANYLMVKAYHYTTVTSVQVLDCFTIPTVLILTRIIFKIRYQLSHFIGVVICLLGLAALIGADILVSRHSAEALNKFLGDVFVLLGAVLYGFSNVAQEYFVRNFSFVEFLGMLGFFASLINGIQFVILERQEVFSVDFTNYKVYLPLGGFILVMIILYSIMPKTLKKIGATAVNLNLLSADFYALLAGLIIFKYKFHFLYFIAFAAVIIGVIVYSIKPVNNTETITIEVRKEDEDIDSKQLRKETAQPWSSLE